MKTTWILIANASEARLFQAEKVTKKILLIDEFFHPASRKKIASLVTDVPGRYRKSTSTPLSSFEETFNPKQAEALRFARELAEKLNLGRATNRYTNLILVAPPHFQGLLNKCCNHHVKNLISNTLDKDYTKIREYDLPHYLNGKLSFRNAA
ncbi:MAG: host attachment protein [Gammaproteobacteria bacterium]|nr:host attachment protein [Gammaproteobacteria bacterium]